MIHTMKKKNIFWVVICLLLTGAPALLNADSDEEEYTNITDTKLPALKLKHTFCAMKADNGPCRAMITRFFFNIHTQQCEDFIYGGCEGNQNQFESLEECKEKCIIDYPKEISKVKLQKEKPEFCFLEEDAGICRGYITRYFYNNQSKQCERFKYGGCLGNPNNFESLEECEKICKATLDDFQVDDSRTQHDAVKNNTLTSQTTNVSRLWVTKERTNDGWKNADHTYRVFLNAFCIHASIFILELGSVLIC